MTWPGVYAVWCLFFVSLLLSTLKKKIKKNCHTLHKETLQQQCIGMGILFFYENSNATCPRTGNSLSSSLTQTLAPRKRQKIPSMKIRCQSLLPAKIKIQQQLKQFFVFFFPSKMWEILTCTLSDELLPLH